MIWLISILVCSVGAELQSIRNQNIEQNSISSRISPQTLVLFLFTLLLSAIMGAFLFSVTRVFTVKDLPSWFDWKHNPRSEQDIKRYQMAGGIINTGNTCYMNSIMQSLASLSDTFDSLTVSDDPLEHGRLKVNKELRALFDQLNTLLPYRHTHNCSGVLSAVGPRRWIPNTEQQDAHEFLLVLFEALRAERNKALMRKSKLATTMTISLQKLAYAFKNKVSQSQLRIKLSEELKQFTGYGLLPFEGLMASRIRCDVCEEGRFLTQQVFSSIELVFPSSSVSYDVYTEKSISLMAMLRSHTDPEPLQGVHCQRCTLNEYLKHTTEMIETCLQTQDPNSRTDTQLSLLENRRDKLFAALARTSILDSEFDRIKPSDYVSTTKTKQVAVGRAPRVLVIHVNRLVYDARSYNTDKCFTQVKFPEYFSLDEFMSPLNPSREDSRRSRSSLASSSSSYSSSTASLSSTPSSSASVMSFEMKDETEYELSSVVVHYGRHDSSGHYLCYRRLHGGGWIRASDQDVRQASREEVFAESGAVILFYRRCEVDHPRTRSEKEKEKEKEKEASIEVVTQEKFSFTAQCEAVNILGTGETSVTDRPESLATNITLPCVVPLREPMKASATKMPIVGVPIATV
ncbi:uncharacterized protein V1516DRAFT_669686 [Lipomyces oligophaga]|uniref:uncharacterized protein n=1 Tax=Lipomyces oligophaga TaxID=45792 RepID=UPI0034CEF2B1